MLVVGVVAALCGSVSQAQFTDSVIARVQDEIITAYQVYEESQPTEQALERRYSGKKLEEMKAKLRNQVAVRMIEQELIYAEFKTLGVEVPGNLVQQRLDRLVKTQTDGDRAKFEEMLEKRHLTLKEFQKKLTRSLAVELLVREKVQRNVEVGPAQVKAHHNEHLADFTEKPQVRVQAIAIRADGKYKGKQDETVRKVLAELAAGKPFAELARTYSEGPFADKGGDRGWQETSVYPEKLRDALTAMAPGTYRKEALKMGDTEYILFLAERKDGGPMPLDSGLQERIRDALSQKEEAVRYRDFISELRRKYFVKIFDSDLAKYWNSLQAE
jgi:parvulin-like peptidyl-prolyl isomerase